MQRLLFIGIAGHAMRGLAFAASQLGYDVVGFDSKAVPPGSDWLDLHGLKWTRVWNLSLLDGVDRILMNNEIAADDPLIVEAKKRGIKLSSFAEFLGEITTGKHVISVAGTHGKTTTASLITWLLEAAGRRPDFLIGIQPFNFDASARLTGSNVVVIEGDEYISSMLDRRSKFDYYHPDILALTMVEMDHPDVFHDLSDIKDRFIELIGGVPEDGEVIAWADNPTVMELAAHARAKVVSYGLDDGQIRARNAAFLPTGIEFDLDVNGDTVGRLAVPLFGRHNILNSLAAVAVVLREGLTFDQILAGASKFKGAYRRFNIMTGSSSKVTVIDDYAHHPTEVRATIEAAKLHYAKSRLIVVFRPHTYSRTRTLLHDFQQAFAAADVTYITEVESARESRQEATVSGEDIVKGASGEVVFEPDRVKIVETIAATARPGDVVLCMSVSGYDKLAEELARKLG